ncbi:hypothetical protein [Solicola gregarius]|uniref:Uncharacterized protein n=1 Tax=Solicola gregarius TaxID=2908642 RepID=A0AA46TFC6_9ACTN|nr:hypothetical protein [Solicola gregarius]UYM04158.1 hypothetical protein L0C25_16630 [Solicola gregarius]
MSGFGGNGSWVPTHNKQGAKAFIAGRKNEAERREAQRERERYFFADVRRWVRSRFTRRS